MANEFQAALESGEPSPFSLPFFFIYLNFSTNGCYRARPRPRRLHLRPLQLPPHLRLEQARLQRALHQTARGDHPLPSFAGTAADGGWELFVFLQTPRRERGVPAGRSAEDRAG